ncbi:MAG: Crp/Fnr family transcriptional regulator [Solirubrobacteraceae bacterium]
MPAFISNVLVDDPDLAHGLDDRRLRLAQRDLVAGVVALTDRRWAPDEAAEAARGGIGLLILEGLLVRRVGSEGRFGAELLGPGDVLRPWEHEGEDATLPFDSTFVVVERVLMAQLDRDFSRRVAAYPEVMENLVGRALARARSLAVTMAIAHQRRVDRRLLMLLWHLAERWGRVTPDGVRVPLHITHQVLADLVAARRPAVTTALAQLEEEHLVRRIEGGWLLADRGRAGLYDLPAADLQHT